MITLKMIDTYMEACFLTGTKTEAAAIRMTAKFFKCSVNDIKRILIG